MLKNINKIHLSIIFLLSCSGGGSSPASPDDGSDNNGNTGDSYVFPNATVCLYVITYQKKNNNCA